MQAPYCWQRSDRPATFTCITCGMTELWTGLVPIRHLQHDTFQLCCDVCQRTFHAPAQILQHFADHALAVPSPRFPLCHSTPMAPPPSCRDDTSSPWSRATIPATPSQSMHNVLHSSSSHSSLPPGQIALPAADVPLSPIVAGSDRVLVRRMAEHLVWLATAASQMPILHPTVSLPTFFAQANAALTSPLTADDTAFRRQLAIDHPATLARAASMPTQKVARILLPIYERWLADARSEN